MSSANIYHYHPHLYPPITPRKHTDPFSFHLYVTWWLTEHDTSSILFLETISVELHSNSITALWNIDFTKSIRRTRTSNSFLSSPETNIFSNLWIESSICCLFDDVAQSRCTRKSAWLEWSTWLCLCFTWRGKLLLKCNFVDCWEWDCRNRSEVPIEVTVHHSN